MFELIKTISISKLHEITNALNRLNEIIEASKRNPQQYIPSYKL